MSRRISLAVIASLFAIGCSGDPKPAARTALHPFPIAQDPVLSAWGPYSGTRDSLASDIEYTIQLPESVLSKISEIDDIRISLHHPSNCDSLYSYMYFWPAPSWTLVRSRPGGGACNWSPVVGWWLLSIIGTEPTERFIAGNGLMRVRGNVWTPRVWGLNYDPAYEYTVLSANDYPGYAGIGYDGEHFILALVEEYGVDSLITLGSDGHRIRSTTLHGQVVCEMTSGTSPLMAIKVGNPPVICQLSTSGSLTDLFRLPEAHWDNAKGGLAWADSSLWYLSHHARFNPYGYDMFLHAIDVAASIDSGYAVIRRAIRVPSDLRDCSGFIFDGTNFQFVAGGIEYERFVISTEGEVLLRQPIPFDGGRMAWDGEAICMLHNGPSEFGSLGLMLSRFSVAW